MSSWDQLRFGLAVGIGALGIVSITVDIISPTYNAPPLLTGTFTLLVTFLFVVKRNGKTEHDG